MCGWRRWVGAPVALMAAGCGLAPAPMTVGDASAFLEQFVDGAAPADVCTAEGRSMLRGAVRAYGAAMARNGVAWPTLPSKGRAAEDLTSVEATVLISFAAGFVEGSDLRASARVAAEQITHAYLPQIANLRGVVHQACEEMVALQQTTARYVWESARLHALQDFARENGDAARQRARSHEIRVARARDAMALAARAVELRIAPPA